MNLGGSSKPRVRVRTINLVLLAHTGLLIAFDHLPDVHRLAAAGVLAAAYGLLCITAMLANKDRLVILLLAALSLLPISWGLSAVLQAQSWESTLGAGLRALSPYVAGIALVAQRDNISPRVLGWAAAAICIAAVTAAVSFPPVQLGGVTRWHPFAAGLHSSAYVMALVAILSMERLHMRRDSLWFWAILLCSSVTFVWMYRVRTAIVLLAVYAAAKLAVGYSLRGRSVASAAGVTLVTLAGCLAVLAAYFMTVDWDIFNALSSGRISNYAERMVLLSQRTVAELLFGTGPGSDRIFVSAWWWEEKDSHSDFLQLLWEGGLLSTFAVCASLIVLLRSGQARLLPLLGALCVSSAISNALLARPNVSFLFFCIVALVLASPKSDNYGEIARGRRSGMKMGGLNAEYPH